MRIKRLTDEICEVVTRHLVSKQPNRANGDEVLAKERARGHRAGRAISVSQVEIDHLDLSAERHGFGAMDWCLRSIG
ncbi:hypothetical protein LPB72_00695 [Hydrogenophaga crassostreae]|uniref:Uncharacterized protein n=1 Tax=Hydrogenophaga crassostreae TaxID=1763535 RepID=A0A162W5M6_9BURK|nr:hypothetical protein [Hydrogenophaga crassostreae]AOW13970.1 hypothetical protein LPB072_15125 [Hydrogenophaga crassostreae]OAD44066.1 hypothetical protein LPB72_00695 [Hydrogenophaga crassostreae]